MAFAHTIGNTRYAYADLRELLAKATPLRSGVGLNEESRLLEKGESA
jgi:ethanolamine ammonia-lyase large subunit